MTLSKKFIPVILFLMLFSTPTGVWAEEATPNPSARPAWKDQLKEKREAFKQQMATAKTEWKEQREEHKTQLQVSRQEWRSTVAQNHALRLENRFGRYGNRLNNIVERLQTWLNTLKSEGKDVSTAQAKLDEAKTKLASAKTLGLDAVAKFKAIDPAKYEEQRDQALAARDVAQQARLAFMDALKLIKQVRDSLKGLRPSASPTVSPSN